MGNYCNVAIRSKMAASHIISLISRAEMKCL